MYWELAGNKVVTGMTAFLGTTSPHPLRIRTNTAVPTQPVGTQPKLDAQEAMRITPFQPGPTPQRGSVGIWTDAPRRALHVQGSEIHSGGAGAGFSFGNRETPDPFSVPVPNNGERWVWYASGGTARLWSLTDKIAVTPAGRVGIGTIAPGAILDISGSGGASQCCAPVVTTLSLAEASSAQNRQAWLQFHNGGEAEMYIRLAGGGPAGSGREGQRRLEIGDNQGANSSLRVNGDLNVGKIDPGARLEVAGGDIRL